MYFDTCSAMLIRLRFAWGGVILWARVWEISLWCCFAQLFELYLLSLEVQRADVTYRRVCWLCVHMCVYFLLSSRLVADAQKCSQECCPVRGGKQQWQGEEMERQREAERERKREDRMTNQWSRFASLYAVHHAKLMERVETERGVRNWCHCCPHIPVPGQWLSRQPEGTLWEGKTFAFWVCVWSSGFGTAFLFVQWSFKVLPRLHRWEV